MLQYESGVVENADMNSMMVVVPYETEGAGYQSPSLKTFLTGHYSWWMFISGSAIWTT